MLLVRHPQTAEGQALLDAQCSFGDQRSSQLSWEQDANHSAGSAMFWLHRKLA